MRIIAIDPGPAESAEVWWEGGRVVLAKKIPSADVLSAPHCWADLVAIEMIASYGMAVGREVFETCVWIGRYVERAGATPTRRITRGEVKMHLCHSMRAKDGNIRQALIDKLGPPGTKKNPGPTYGVSGDMWAALGVAVTAAETPEPAR